MKKKYTILTAVTLTGLLLAGGIGMAVASERSEKMVQEFDQTGIRAKAPQGVKSEQKKAGADDGGTSGDTGKNNAHVSDVNADGTKRDSEQIAAIEAALADAGLTEPELTGLRIKKERDDGKMTYEVELYVGAEEYSYEIDAKTAEILEQDYDTDENYDREPDDPDALTREEATQIVLNKVEGATDMDIRIRYEYDDGKELYEGDLFYDGTEYEFELSAKDGQILEWSEEKY